MKERITLTVDISTYLLREEVRRWESDLGKFTRAVEQEIRREMKRIEQTATRVPTK